MMKFAKRITNFFVRTQEQMKANKKSLYQVSISVSSTHFKRVILQLNTDTLPFSQEIIQCINYFQDNNQYLDEKYFVSIFFFEVFATQKQLLPMVFLSKENDLILYTKESKIIPDIFETIQDGLKKLLPFEYVLSSGENFLEDLSERVRQAEEFYIQKNGSWINSFFEILHDDLSKISLRTYLQQRITGLICGGFDIVYPIRPPVQTQAWREKKIANPPLLPTIEGCSNTTLKFFHLTTFILEQYTIANQVEVQPKDIVIDAGGFVGDTAIYFANKVGEDGKVYVFEPILETADIAKYNLAQNGFTRNTEVIPLALSNKSQTLYFTNEGQNSTGISSRGIDIRQRYREVPAISLDDYVSKHQLEKVDFIKADLQGSDVSFVEGSLETIKRFGPTCGLTVYHKKEDFINIPKLLMASRNDYLYFFRCEAEPVVFAITEDRFNKRKLTL